MRTDHIRWVEDTWTEDPSKGLRPVTKPGRKRLELQPWPEMLKGPAGLPTDDTAFGPPDQWSVDPNLLDTWETPYPPVPVIDLPLERPERAIFFLSVAAEIEHALMAMYLYAAYSVRIPTADEIPNGAKVSLPDNGSRRNEDLTPAHVSSWKHELLQIAREEMSHLASVQNLLRSLGGPLIFSRGDGPFNSVALPFRFRLERLSLASLSKYVTAERPVVLPDQMPDEEKRLVKKIYWQAFRANDDIPVKQVGGVFSDLCTIIDEQIQLSDFHTDTAAFQARYSDWGFNPVGYYNRRLGIDGEDLIVETIAPTGTKSVKEVALDAIEAIAEQGEGWDLESGQDQESHFERFFELYRQLQSVQISAGGWTPTWPVATNPNTTGERDKPLKSSCAVTWAHESAKASSRIEHTRSRAWARLLNLRYRLLLSFLHHFLVLPNKSYVDQQDVDQSGGQLSAEGLGDRTARGLLLIWTFDEMRRVKFISELLVQLPLNGDGELHAGPPFELPYYLCLPDREVDRWKSHYLVSWAASQLIHDELLENGEQGEPEQFLRQLLARDAQAQQAMQALSQGQTLPPQPQGFDKVAQILEESVRGFDVLCFHENFWRDISEQEFLGDSVDGLGRVVVKGNADDSQVFSILKTSDNDPSNMPLGRPAVPASRREFIRSWINSLTPTGGVPGGGPGGETASSRAAMVELLKTKRQIAQFVHGAVPANGSNLSQLFTAEDYDAILKFLESGDAKRPPVAGKPLVVAGKPDESAIITQIQDGVMSGQFTDAEIQIVKKWIESLT